MLYRLQLLSIHLHYSEVLNSPSNRLIFLYTSSLVVYFFVILQITDILLYVGYRMPELLRSAKWAIEKGTAYAQNVTWVEQ